MTSIELKERLEKAQATVEKKRATIERHKQQAEKKLQILKKATWLDTTNPDEHKWNEEERARYTAETGRDLYWDFCDYEHKLEDIKSATEKLAEAKQIADNWEKKYSEALERELTIVTEVPEAFKQARAELVKRWVKQDIKEREVMLQKKKELSYEEFRKLYKYTEEESLTHTDEEFRKIEEREADYWLINLYNRVKEITGEVTDCSSLYWGGKCLDGYVIGKNGRAKVETIGAGGYNIQRFHLRVLVNEY